MKETYKVPIEKIGDREPSGSGFVWHAFNTQRENGVLGNRIAQVIGPLSSDERSELLRLSHFPLKFWIDENTLRGDGLSVAEGIFKTVLDHGYPANVLIIQLAGVETLLPFLSEYWGSQLKESMSKLLKQESSIKDVMRRREHRL